MRHEMLPYRPSSLIPPQMVKACLQAVFIIGGALVLTALVMALTLAAGRLSSAQGAETGEEMPSGLFFRSADQSSGLEAPTLSSDVSMAVNGMVNRVTLRQVFHNPTNRWMEGIYVFPLPERSAVDRLALTIGERRVAGKIMEKAEAERAYKAAAENGQRASLVSGERPNVFVTSVANIGPGEKITVEIGYQDTVAFENGVFSLRFPMVVAPRYSLAPPAMVEAPSNQPLQPAVDRDNPNGTRDLFGPVTTAEKLTPLSLTVKLNAGMDLRALRSLYHPVVIETADGSLQKITPRDGSVPADRDFVLEWAPIESAAPQAAVFGEQVGEDTHLLVMMVPPSKTGQRNIAEEPKPAPMPRELVFIIDTSGSMFGESLDQAKTAVIAALKRLNPEDRFNVIQFNSETHALYPRPVTASIGNVAQAFHYVSALEADGGTEMAPALGLALTGGPDDGYISQIVFLTDGAVGNEDELFRLLAEQLGDSRLFTIGIGAAPNSYFMRKSAELGRGGFTHIGDLTEVAARMEALFAKLENPALTDIRVGWPLAAGKRVEAYPIPLPDLYSGEPVTFSARLGGIRLDDLNGQMLITGTGIEGPWQQRLDLSGLQNAPGTASLWARAKLVDIEDQLYQPGRGIDRTAVRAEALALALEHDMVTRYTSLVAIDAEIARPQGEALQSEEIERNLPAGWDAGKVFGGQPGEANPAAEAPMLRQHALPAPLLQTTEFNGQPVVLPQGATPAERMLIIGLAYLLLGLGLLALVRYRSRRGTLSGGAPGGVQFV